MTVRVHPSDQVVIVAGPLAGQRGEVRSVDPEGGLAYVSFRPPSAGGLRYIAVVRLSQLRTDDGATSLSVKGRPRIITEETVEQMHALRVRDGLTHRQIAARLGISSSSVTAYLRRRAQQ
jgi:hypothetical protein